MTANHSPVDAVLLGAGGRGASAYGAYALRHPEDVRFVAVAEPDPARRASFAATHHIAPDRCFETWQDLLAAGQLAPALLCCTQDRMHVAPTLAALRAGYHVLLEKPMAVTPEECARLVQASEAAGRLLMVCHVLRYTPFFSTLRAVISSGRLGDIVTIEHRENVAFWHMAHSFVRGNWGNAERSSPMILAKCCHDLDVLLWMTEGLPVTRLQSFGSLLHFRPENRPPGAPARCTDGCPVADACLFYAPRLYMDMQKTDWPIRALGSDLSYDGRLHALRTGPYGRCVYHGDNDVVDHQVVSMEHAGGAVTTLVMHGHSHEEGRTMRYDGTRATLRATFTHGGPPEIAVYDHRTGQAEMIPIGSGGEGGHGGGDGGLMQAFARAVRDPGAPVLTTASASLESHLLAFAAERARVTGRTVDMASYRAEIETAARGVTA
ncbi:MAG: Gfo/Idh/MocA family oxidoreductase [Chloroflexota bacterium]